MDRIIPQPLLALKGPKRQNQGLNKKIVVVYSRLTFE